MDRIYLDNAATTPILPEVIDIVAQTMRDVYGNPSSTHQIGRKAKSLVETARKNIAKHFNANANEIVFTAGGSEADNLVLINAVQNLGVKTLISSKIEHHAVLHTLEYLKNTYDVEVKWVSVNELGEVDLKHLENVLESAENKCLVSLMYVNNEIGNLLNVQKVGELCQLHDAYFHSDAVQAVGHFTFDPKALNIDFFAASAHKFHGPKGVGFAYVRSGIGIQPLLHGGEQERGARAGTENVHSILGMEKALEISYANLEDEQKQIQELKSYFIKQLKSAIDGVQFNGTAEDEATSSYIILNVRFPKNLSMLIFSLDLDGISVSGGSACQSGSNKGSHVLNELLNEEEAKKTSVRFSFNKFNTKEEIDSVIEKLKKHIP